ncbi:MAG: M24 family metallopeptidase [Alicyclobacillaceae bacterium]|nr:M24 family metallopeptidase [Alicyclobacillaceae bacterium]
MRTMHPVVLRGCSTWDRHLLPDDEFRSRVRDIQQRMQAENVDGMLVFGSSAHYGALCYFSNYVPKLEWAMVYIPQSGAPSLLVRVLATRDLPGIQSETWVEDIRAAHDLEVLLERLVTGADGRSPVRVMGLYGDRWLPSPLYARISAVLARHGVPVRDVQPMVDALMWRKRPRELRALREACAILGAAVQTAVQQPDHVYATHRLLAAERVAWDMGARDVRTMFSLDGGVTFGPFETHGTTVRDPLIFYMAVQYQGYWAGGFVTAGQTPSPLYEKCRQALDDVQSSLRPGLAVADVYTMVQERTSPHPWHPVLEGAVGHGIGLFLEEGPRWTASACAKLEANGVYSLQVGLAAPADGGHAAILSRMVAVTDKAVEVLWDSDAYGR